MGLSAEDIGKLTLGEVEAIATRYAAAVATIREAQLLLGGGNAPKAYEAAAMVPPLPIRPQAQVSPDRQAELDAWKKSPARQKLLEQFKPDPEAAADGVEA